MKGGGPVQWTTNQVAADPALSVVEALIRRKPALLVGCCIATLVGCTDPSGGVTRPLIQTSAGASSVAAKLATDCRRPSVRMTTKHPFYVGAPGSPTAGPLSLHPEPYHVGYPTKMIIYVEHTQTAPVVLQGLHCSDQRVLRFWYHDRDILPATPPLTQRQFSTLGEVEESLGPASSHTVHTGYALFSAPGEWIIEVFTAKTTLGSVLIDVVAT